MAEKEGRNSFQYGEKEEEGTTRSGAQADGRKRGAREEKKFRIFGRHVLRWRRTNGERKNSYNDRDTTMRPFSTEENRLTGERREGRKKPSEAPIRKPRREYEREENERPSAMKAIPEERNPKGKKELLKKKRKRQATSWKSRSFSWLLERKRTPRTGKLRRRQQTQGPRRPEGSGGLTGLHHLTTVPGSEDEKGWKGHRLL